VTGPVRGLLVDVDDTLVNTRAAMRAGVLAAVLQFLPDLEADGRATAVEVWLADPAGAFTAYRRGELTFGEQRRVRAERLHAALGGPSLGDGALAEWEAVYDVVFRGSWQVLPDAVELLALVRGLGLPCGAVTNAPRAYQEDKLRALDLADLPVLVATDDLGVGKPEPAVFRLGCERLGLPPDAVAYVGDELDVDARGARDAGLLGVWLDRHGSGLRPDDVPTVADLTELPGVLGLPALRRRA